MTPSLPDSIGAYPTQLPVDPTDLHMIISSLSAFRVSNRYTFGAIFGVDFSDPAVRKRHRKLIGETILKLVTNG